MYYCVNTLVRRLPAAHSTAVDASADERARGSTEDRASRPLAMRVDRPANQRSAGSADDESGGSIGPLAAQPAMGIAPNPALIIMGPRRGGRLHHRDRHRRRGQNQHCLSHPCSPYGCFAPMPQAVRRSRSGPSQKSSLIVVAVAHQSRSTHRRQGVRHLRRNPSFVSEIGDAMDAGRCNPGCDSSVAG